MRRLSVSLLCLAVAALAACDGMAPGNGSTGSATTTYQQPSANSRALADRYARLERDLVARGLLRTDGGGPDTPYTPEMLARNFERIAFYDEYTQDSGLKKSNAGAGQIKRWSGPVRVSVEFGQSVHPDVRAQDNATISRYVQRLAGITDHPITVSRRRANFHVLVMGADDRSQLEQLLRQILPNASASTVALLTNPPHNIHCLVIAFSNSAEPNAYRTAVALVRAEHPDLLRKACYHEEIAQGLGLANDSPHARPSIFNDDDEFALLTTHDEALLSMLYDPRLSIGMTLGQARPIVQQMAREKAGRLY